VYVLAVDLRGLEKMLAVCMVWIPVLRVDDVHVDETFVAASSEEGAGRGPTGGLYQLRL
jgi:hypothetical protein